MYHNILKIIQLIYSITGIYPTNVRCTSNRAFVDFRCIDDAIRVMELTDSHLESGNVIMKLEYNEQYNDWICSECSHRNYPSRDFCSNCGVESNLDMPYVLFDRSTIISNELCLRGIPPTIKEPDIHKALPLQGIKLTKIKIVRNQKTRTSKMYGFLTFETKDDATHLFSHILSNGFFIENQPISVAFAKGKVEDQEEEKKWKEQYIFEGKTQQQDQTNEDQLPTCNEHIHYYRTQSSLIYFDGSPYFSYDPSSKYFYNPYTKMHYDDNTGYYFDNLTQQWMYYDPTQKSYQTIQSATSKLEDMLNKIESHSSDENDDEGDVEGGFFGYKTKDKPVKISEHNQPASQLISKLNNKDELIEKIVYIEPTVDKVLPAIEINTAIIRKASTVTKEAIEKRKRIALELFQASQPKKVSNKQRLVHAKPLPSTHFGYQALLSMGWKDGEGLGKNGIVEPLPILSTHKLEGIGFNAKSVSVEHVPNENDTYKESSLKKLASRFQNSNV